MKKETSVKLLKLCTFLIFLGRGYQYLFFDAPFRALLWDESLLQPIIEGWFNTPWNDYVTNLKIDAWIQKSIRINGIIFVLAAFSSLFIHSKNSKYLRIPIWVGGFFLVILSFLTMKEHFFHYAQFLEHAIQFGIPFLLLYGIKENSDLNHIKLFSKILIAVTFISHGLYALGYYPIPGYFIDMTINSLGVTEKTAVTLLLIAGILDILISIAIFIPKISKYVLLYAIIWGFLTALARMVGNFNTALFALSMHQSVYKVIFRLSHSLIPLLVFITEYRYIKKNNPKPQISIL